MVEKACRNNTEAKALLFQALKNLVRTYSEPGF